MGQSAVHVSADMPCSRHNRTDRADAHRRTQLIRRFGLQPWLSILAASRLQAQTATAHMQTGISRKAFQRWRMQFHALQSRKVAIADKLASRFRAVRTIQGWHQVRALVVPCIDLTSGRHSTACSSAATKSLLGGMTPLARLLGTCACGGKCIERVWVAIM
jgi:hypothetical protein